MRIENLVNKILAGENVRRILSEAQSPDMGKGDSSFMEEVKNKLNILSKDLMNLVQFIGNNSAGEEKDAYAKVIDAQKRAKVPELKDLSKAFENWVNEMYKSESKSNPNAPKRKIDI